VDTGSKREEIESQTDLKVRLVQDADLTRVIELDALVTGVAKDTYWHELYARHRQRSEGEEFFFVAEGVGALESTLLGYVIGEVRAWEFGSEPCGWLFALAVRPDARQMGVGEQLMTTLSDAFRNVDVTTMRTMISRDNHLFMSFFRSEGMMAGPYIQLEKDLKP